MRCLSDTTMEARSRLVVACRFVLGALRPLFYPLPTSLPPAPVQEEDCTGFCFFLFPTLKNFWSWEMMGSGAAAVCFSPSEDGRGMWQFSLAWMAGVSLKQSPFFLWLNASAAQPHPSECCAPLEGFPSAVQIDHCDCLEAELATSCQSGPCCTWRVPCSEPSSKQPA